MFKKSAVFHAWGQYCGAGMNPIEALRIVRPGWTGDAKDWNKWLKETTVLKPTERVCLTAATETGQLPAVLAEIAQMHEVREKVVSTMVSRSLYPLFLMHFALVIGPITKLLNNPVGFAGIVLLHWASLWLAMGVAGALMWKTRKIWLELWPVTVFQLPWSRFRFSQVLVLTYKAGIGIHDAWRYAFVAAKPKWAAKYEPYIRQAQKLGQGPEKQPVIAAWMEPEFLRAYNTGVQTGTIDQTIERMSRIYWVQVEMRMAFLAKFVSGVFFLLAAVIVGYSVLSFYVGYFQQMDKLIGG